MSTTNLYKSKRGGGSGFVLCLLLSALVFASLFLPAKTASADAASTRWETLIRRFTDEASPDKLISVTPEERLKIHSNVDALAGDIGKPASLIGEMAASISFDSISRGGRAPAAYPFRVSSNEFNDNEGARKTAMFAWAKRLARTLGFPVVAQRQADKYVYAEFGDPDAPEMIMAFGHLDSPPASVTAAQLALWRGADGMRGAKSAYFPNQYKTPYIMDGWLYGVGAQDDSGPTTATLFAAKALMDAGLPMDRRIRIVMGGYEDGGPGTPSVTNTLKFMDIPYYTANPRFYDNWAYKSLNREEMPIAAFTADSRFPMVIGNSANANRTVSINLAGDSKKAFRLVSGSFAVTERAGDETLKDIIHGAATLTASLAKFIVDVSGASPASRDKFVKSLAESAAAKGWSGRVKFSEPPALPDCVELTVNTDVPMEYTTPQYGRNAIVWGMVLLSEALGNAGVASSDLQLKKAADGITDLFLRNGIEDYIGGYMGIPPSLLRNPDNGCPNLTFALGALGARSGGDFVNFYDPVNGKLSVTVFSRSMHVSSAKYNAACVAVTNAWNRKGFSMTAAPKFSNPTLYMSHDNPLTALYSASYKASINSAPDVFNRQLAFLGVSRPQGSIGGTLAADFFNKMNAFGAIFPCDESWWHTPNERIKVSSAIQMTKVFADALLEMSRYSGPAGAKFMWADIPGLNADRADPDLLDVTIGTYEDASGIIPPAPTDEAEPEEKLLAAVSFDIPMFRQRGNSQLTDAQITAGHNPNYPGIKPGTQIYLDPSTIPVSETFVLPMRLEFKIEKHKVMNDEQWRALSESDINTLSRSFSFGIISESGGVIPLTLPAGERADMFYHKRVSKYDPNTVYISVNIAVSDSADTNVTAVIAESKDDLYRLSSSYTGRDPFPERAVKKKRGFFLLGDGNKNARFTSPGAVFVRLSN